MQLILPILVLATHNRDKIKEITGLAAPLPITIKTLDDFADFPEVDETEATLEGNALKKAREIYAAVGGKFSEVPEATSVIVLSDDTGLEVDALGGAPGVYSARYASRQGEKVSYAQNVEKLLSEMDGIVNRRAQFRTVVAMVGNFSGLEKGKVSGFGKPNGASYFEKSFEGVATGEITAEQRGQSGFGYDPVFLSDALRKTFAELSSTDKNLVSHRGIAVRKALSFLQSLMTAPE
ncbi:MAG: non-canonical purine NTP pyrophosphatase [Rhizobacter sp.]|nr:non-canonical purine NTP pyrophosphatase [Chlorobiales bacterium]